MKRTTLFSKGVFLALAIVLMLALIPTASTAASPSAPDPGVRTSADGAVAKIHPRLRAQLGLQNGALSAMAASDELQILVYVNAGTDISRYMVWSLTRPFIDPLGHQAVTGVVKAGNILKIASLPDVAAVKPFENTAELPRPLDDEPGLSKAALQARQEALRAAGVTGWWDVGPGHNAEGAWDLGYTGQGVKAMVNDSSVDFAHPDLMGKWAVIEDPDSPYYGWPEMFDDYSLYWYVIDNYFGTSFVAAGYTDYADTSSVCNDPCVYAPLGATEAHTYTLPATSVSGDYHIGSHPDKALADAINGDWNGKAEGEERVAILVVDENEAGVYDTVYVDINGDFDFTNDKPVTKDSPISYLDYWDSAADAPGSDGYADLSGGLVYFIADGVNPIPASDWLWGPNLAPPPGNGNLVAFVVQDYTDPAGDHGQLVASAIAGQGVIDGGAPAIKPPGDGTPFTGLVPAAGRDTKLTVNGNWYVSPYVEDGHLFAALGYDGIPGTGDDIQLINNSWGFSDTDNDGWDFDSRNLDAIIRHLNPTLTSVHSTGNGGPGYGTISPPNPPASIAVGASSQYDTGGVFETLISTDQINWGDVAPFSNRGPGARGTNGVHVTANGSWGTGDLPLNMVGDGWVAWDLWGGTSRSAPVAVGLTSLIYDAYKQANGTWPTWDVVRAILMAGADNQNYDGFTQGAGSINGGTSASIAGGDGGFFTMPDSWTAGNYRGVEYPGFANIVHAGDVVTKTFTIYNPAATDAEVNLSSDHLVKIAEYSFPFTTQDQSLEEGQFPKPDYLFDVTDLIPEGTALMEVKMAYPFDQLDANGDYSADSRWYLQVQNWTDINGDGMLWQDLNGDGVVNSDEIQDGEYVRFGYNRPGGDSFQVRVKEPLEQMHDGIFIGIRHRVRSEDIPVTNMKFTVTFYGHGPFDWLSIEPMSVTVPAGDSATFVATMAVPEDAPVGLYEAFILADAANGSMQDVIPVVVNVAATSADFRFGGGRPADTPYDNGRMFGYFDWTWRAESGDWRFFYTDINEDLPDGSMLLVDNRWESSMSDIDTLVMGPVPDNFTDPDSRNFEGDYFGPYTLTTLPGSSANTYIGSGRWIRNTSTGGPREIVAVPATQGLHVIALHNVLYGGEYTDEAFRGQVGTLNVAPSALDLDAPSNSVYAEITVSSSLALDDLVAEGFGLGLPELYTDQVVNQDNPNDPSTASYTRTVTIDHAASLDVQVAGQGDTDLDLFVYDPSGNLVGASTTPTADEHVFIKFPVDGDWTIAVHGWSVPTGTTTFDLQINAVQGYDVQVVDLPQGPFAPGEDITFGVRIERAMSNGDVLYGSVLLGPAAAPGLVEVPITVTAVEPDPITVELPLTADTWVNGGDVATNNNSFAALIARTTGLDNVLLEFDRSALPVGANVIAAELMANVTGQSGQFGKSLTVLNSEAFDPATVTYATAPTTFNPSAAVAVPETPGMVSFDVANNVLAWDAVGAQAMGDMGYLAISASGPAGRVIFDSLETWNATPVSLQVTYIPERGFGQ